MTGVRPTIRCLGEDLGYQKLPPATEPLDRLDLPLLRKARQVCRTDPPNSERIASIDDEVLWKVKIERWRGAIWCSQPSPWLVAAGRREEGSPDDFYDDLVTRGTRWRAAYNRSHRPHLRTDTLVRRLLPTVDDEARLNLERSVAAVDELRAVVYRLTVEATRTETEQSDESNGCTIAILVRRGEFDAIYVGVRIIGPVQTNVTAVILRAVPAVSDPNGWFLDEMPSRTEEPGELVWSNLLDRPKVETLLHTRE